jgi:hypothetical protein
LELGAPLPFGVDDGELKEKARAKRNVDRGVKDAAPLGEDDEEEDEGVGVEGGADAGVGEKEAWTGMATPDGSTTGARPSDSGKGQQSDSKGHLWSVPIGSLQARSSTTHGS